MVGRSAKMTSSHFYKSLIEKYNILTNVFKKRRAISLGCHPENNLGHDPRKFQNANPQLKNSSK